MLWLTDESDVTGVRDDTVIFDRDWNMLLVVVVSVSVALESLLFTFEFPDNADEGRCFGDGRGDIGFGAAARETSAGFA